MTVPCFHFCPPLIIRRLPSASSSFSVPVSIEHNIYYVLPLLFITNITNLLHLLATVLIIAEFSFSVNLCTYFSTFLKYFNDFPNRFLCILYIFNCPTISRIPILFSTFRQFLQIIPTSLCHNNVIYISFFCRIFYICFLIISKTALPECASRGAFLFTRERSFLVNKKVSSTLQPPSPHSWGNWGFLFMCFSCIIDL